MVSQFVSPYNVGLLGDLGFDFPPGTHAIGRLDSQSEGLLLLTTNKKITQLLFGAPIPHRRTYLVMVQNKVTPESLQQLQQGVAITIKNGNPYIAKPVEALLVTDPAALCPQATDHRERYPHSWLRITLTEGKHHQVRKMVLAIRHRCLRLIRLSIENLTLQGLQPGEIREIEESAFFEKLQLHAP